MKRSVTNTACQDRMIAKFLQCMTTSATSKAVKFERPSWTNFPLDHRLEYGAQRRRLHQASALLHTPCGGC
jgi:hypothetical protein